jgi:hypothetical protein
MRAPLLALALVAALSACTQEREPETAIPYGGGEGVDSQAPPGSAPTQDGVERTGPMEPGGAADGATGDPVQ